MTWACDQQIKAAQRLGVLAAREDELQQGISGGLAARRNAQSRIAELNEQVGTAQADACQNISLVAKSRAAE